MHQFTVTIFPGGYVLSRDSDGKGLVFRNSDPLLAAIKRAQAMLGGAK